MSSLARRICTIVKNENVKEQRFKEWKKNITTTKSTYPKSLTEASILKAKEIPLKALRQPKTTKKYGNYPFHYKYLVMHLPVPLVKLD